MSTAVFYPYRTGPGRITFGLDPVGVELQTSSDRSFIAYGEQLESLRLAVSAAVPDELVGSLLPPEETGNPPVGVRLLCRGKESRKRFVVNLTGDGTVYSGELNLDMNDYAGELICSIAVVRTTRMEVAVPGYASDRGAILAWSEERRILFDAPPKPQGNCLEVLWENFPESVDPWRKRHPDNLFALDLHGARPRIVLNEAIQLARTVLDSAGSHGAKARVRDAAFSMIVHQGWSSLVSVSLARLATVKRDYPDEGADTPAEILIKDLEEWQGIILQDWSRYLFPDEDPATALENMTAAAGEHGKTLEIMGKLPNAIQARFRTYRSFEGLVKEVVMS